MTLDEALQEAVSGARMTATHLDGVYVEHSFSRGFLRCWPVERAEDEPNRSQCAFDPKPEDRAADWFELPTPVYAIDDRLALSVNGKVVGIVKSFEIIKPPKRDLTAEALALMGKPVVVSDSVRDAIRKTIGPNICNDFGKWGVSLSPAIDPDKTSVACPVCSAIHDADTFTECQVCDGKDAATAWDDAPAPKRDSWGRIVP